MVPHIKFENVTLQYPVYNAKNLSLRHNLLEVGTGGRLTSGAGEVARITALDNVSFEIRHGDAIGLIGHNGAGKSTLLRTMAGIYLPVSGRISRQGRIATMFELGAGMDVELSGYENIYRMGLLMGMSRDEIDGKMADIEEFAGLGDFLQLPVRTYSAGMNMRLLFAVSTCSEPEILLIDEVYGAGDAEFKEKAIERMTRFIESAQIFVMASHSLDLIKAHCNRIFELSHGQLRELDIAQI